MRTGTYLINLISFSFALFNQLHINHHDQRIMYFFIFSLSILIENNRKMSFDL